MTEKQNYKTIDFIPFFGANKYRKRNIEDLDNPKVDRNLAVLMVYNGVIGLTSLFTSLYGLEKLFN